MQIIELRDGVAASVRIAPELGGAITAFTWREHPVLRSTPQSAFDAANVRQTACYPLVPYSNRIRNALLTFGGRAYPLARNFGTHPHAIHGVGWQSAWSVAHASPRRARLVLEHDASEARVLAWPWSFRATQAFELAAFDADAERGPHAVLSVTLTLRSLADEPFPFGLGWHPFFPKDRATDLQFAAQAVWENDATQLPLQRIGLPAAWRFDAAHALDDLAFDNVFTQWSGHATLVNRPSGMRTTLAADRACRYLVVYAPPAGDFIALEPVTHETDAFNRHAQGNADTGFRTLAPGAAFSCTMRVAASALAWRGISLHPCR